MDIAALKITPHAADLPLEQLAASQQFSEEEKVGQVSRQFEATLLRQILGQARKTVFTSKVCGNTASSGLYQDMITQHMAEGISRSGDFGLARSLQAELAQQILPRATPAARLSTDPHGTKPPAHD